MALSGFAPSGQASLSANAVSQNVLLPGTPAVAVVTNLGPAPAFIAIAQNGALVATIATGLAILPNTSVVLTVGIVGTYLAAITSQAAPAILNIAVGT